MEQPAGDEGPRFGVDTALEARDGGLVLREALGDVPGAAGSARRCHASWRTAATRYLAGVARHQQRNFVGHYWTNLRGRIPRTIQAARNGGLAVVEKSLREI
ncbi:hypothetical protein [Actinacidiphila yeochonensis]|uniref:hypothetical protein n=1 Tax=Actinacidiphila yeochonensis TaxID=89050 RepID=UPI0012FF4AB5|nr:hypothetical protein [Actinacidiphila yeochonensis]